MSRRANVERRTNETSIRMALSLDGGGSSDPNEACGDSIVRYEWDLNTDGTYEYSGRTVNVPWADLDQLPQGGTPTPIRLRVTDSFGLSDVDATTLTAFYVGTA